MNNKVRYWTPIVFLALFVLALPGWAQLGSHKHSGDRLEEFTDSLKSAEYPYILPVWGEKVAEKGFDIPLPFGIMANYVNSKQNITIENLAVGVNGGPLRDLSDIVRFESAKVNANTLNIRPDTWILPFFNVYGLFGYVDSKTDIKIALPINLSALAEAEGPYYGFGMLLAGGLGPLWISTDYNQAWVNTALLDKPTRARINGIRVGHVWVSKKKTDMNISFWAGAQYQYLASQNKGEVRLGDVITLPEGPDDQRLEELTEWYEGLDPTQQQVVEAVYNALVDFLSGLDDTTIQYEFNKRLKFPWSMAVGFQWQINRIWQWRTEYNFLGSREQLLLSLNYRFGIKGRTLGSK